jgi:excisionase family DNA binding protein
MELTEKELRERGIFRSVEELHSEARAMVDSMLATLPVGRAKGPPGRGFTEGELAVLREGGLTFDASGYGERISRTASKHAAILASSLTVREAAEILGVSEGRIRQKISERRLYSVRGEGGERRLPRFQFSPRGGVPGMEEVVRVVPRGVHPVALQNFFTSPNPDLYLDEEEEVPISPRDWLLSGGDPEAVIPLARELF